VRTISFGLLEFVLEGLYCTYQLEVFGTALYSLELLKICRGREVWENTDSWLTMDLVAANTNIVIGIYLWGLATKYQWFPLIAE